MQGTQRKSRARRKGYEQLLSVAGARKNSVSSVFTVQKTATKRHKEKLFCSKSFLPKKFVILSVIFLFSWQVLSRRLRGWVRILFFTIRVYLRNPRSIFICGSASLGIECILWFEKISHKKKSRGNPETFYSFDLNSY